MVIIDYGEDKMSEYIKDYYRVSKLIMHYQKYNRWIRYGFALLVILGGNLQWAFLITAMIFTYLAVPVAFDGVAYILPLTDEERIKRKLTGALVPMIELSICGALGKVLQYILISGGIFGNPDNSVIVKYPLFSAVFFLTSVLVAADFSLDVITGNRYDVFYKGTKAQIGRRQYIGGLLFQGLPIFIFLSYAFAMCFNFKWIYHFDDMGSTKHLLRLIFCMVLLIIDIINTIGRSLKEVYEEKSA